MFKTIREEVLLPSPGSDPLWNVFKRKDWAYVGFPEDCRLANDAYRSRIIELLSLVRSRDEIVAFMLEPGEEVVRATVCDGDLECIEKEYFGPFVMLSISGEWGVCCSYFDYTIFGGGRA